MRVVVASDNRGKLREIAALTDDLELELWPQSTLGVSAPEETGTSFEANALIKARHAAAQTASPAIADDSGLEVDAIDGAPGVRSARYAGRAATDAANRARLLQALADVPAHRRTARFRCAMVLCRNGDDPHPVVCHGVWEGLILDAPRGKGGFGYDPLFYVPELGRTAAELDPETKNARSHRGQALAGLADALRRLAAEPT